MDSVKGVKCEVHLLFAGIDDFPYVNETHIKEALPFLKSAGVSYYVHAELKPSDDSPVDITPFCANS